MFRGGQGLIEPDAELLPDGLGLTRSLGMALLGRLVPEALLDALERADEVQGLLRFPGLTLFALGDVRLVELAPRMGEAADEAQRVASRGEGCIALEAVGLQVAALAAERRTRGRKSGSGLRPLRRRV